MGASRRGFIAGTAASIAGLRSRPVFAQQFPTKPVTLIVPWPAGGSTDIVLRALAAATEKHLGQPIIIDNRAGAAGTLGPGNMAVNGRPDGYTISQLHIAVFRLPFMQKMHYDPHDFSWIINLTAYTFGTVVRADAPWNTFRELLDDAKANPGKLNYGTPGAGTTLHITMEQIARAYGITWTHVPFKGLADNMSALLGGHIHMLADSSGWAEMVNAGKFRLLVTWGSARTRSWPNVPTLTEAGVNVVSNAPFGLGGPKGMNPAVVKVLHDAFKKGMEEPSYQDVLVRLDMEPAYLNSADYEAFANRSIAEQKRLVEELGLRQ